MHKREENVDRISLAAAMVTNEIVQSAPPEWNARLQRAFHVVYDNAIVVVNEKGKYRISQCITYDKRDSEIQFGNDEHNANVLNSAIGDVMAEFEKSTTPQALIIIMFGNSTALILLQRTPLTKTIETVAIDVTTTLRLYIPITLDSEKLATIAKRATRITSQTGIENMLENLLPEDLPDTPPERSTNP